MEKASKKNAPENAKVAGDDRCDLDPGKICDNCCKCLEKDGADYLDVNASFDAESMRVYYADEQDELPEDDLPPLDIDPALLAEWEDKLRQMELAERGNEESDGEEALYAKHDAAHISGSRTRKKDR